MKRWFLEGWAEVLLTAVSLNVDAANIPRYELSERIPMIAPANLSAISRLVLSTAVLGATAFGQKPAPPAAQAVRSGLGPSAGVIQLPRQELILRKPFALKLKPTPLRKEWAP